MEIITHLIGGIIIIWIIGKTMEKIGDWLDFEYPSIMARKRLREEKEKHL